jgi:arginine decarboxylase
VNKSLHKRTPLFDAVKKHVKSDITPFHVPGHKHGEGLQELRDFLGEMVFKIDLNAMADIDDYCNPISSIRESEELIADAFGAENGYMLLNGTTSGIHAMFLSTCHPGDKIILPRNAHKSTISGLILSGAIPVYVNTDYDYDYGISTTVSTESIKSAFDKEPHAVASFIINPSYYGFTPDLKSIIRTSHRNGAVVLVDEAHGCHMAFHDDFPLTAMEAGADLAAASTHKTSGSLTQSSILLHRGNMVSNDVLKHSLNLIRSTSGSYILMTSIDVARKQLALYGEELLGKSLELVRFARTEINQIDGLRSFGKEMIHKHEAIFDFDETKLTINVHDIGYTGFEIEKKLRDEYKIQVELADLNNIMAIIGIGDTEENINKLINALKDIATNKRKKVKPRTFQVPEMPELIVGPRDAFYSKKKSVLLENSVGEISGESVMAYPPGIPIVCPGERITKDIIDYIKILKDEDSSLQGTSDPYVNHIRVLGN